MMILIAEDDLVARRVLSATLRKLGHEVVSAEDGEEAFAAYAREPFAIVVTDWMMPRLDGLGLCRRIRAEPAPRYTYIIMLTALKGKDRYLEGMNAGADDFVTKPFDRDELQARLRVAARVLGLQAEVKQLEGLLPICSYCKRIRDERNDWSQVEQYLARRTEATFTHGVCPDCFETRLKPQLDALPATGTPRAP